MKRPAIAEVGPEVAAPFVLRYLEEYGLPPDGELSTCVRWWASILEGQVEAVIGLADLDGHMFIYGLYANKGFAAVRAARALIEVVDRLPHERVLAYTLNANAKMIRTAEKFGFESETRDALATKLVRSRRG